LDVLRKSWFPEDREPIACHVCAKAGLRLVPGFSSLRRVTSDSKPWPGNGRLGVCGSCGSVQKVVDGAWQAEVEKIYADYQVYHQGGGAEQQVFALESGKATVRSERILQYLDGRVALPETSRVLDIGCGNGAMLRACARHSQGWVLAGTELSAKYRAQVEGIAGVERLYTCPPDEVPGRFQLITLIHVLEHVPGPVQFLATLRAKVAPGGLLVAEVPDFERNPFDLLVADHCSHLSGATLTNVVRRAGFDVGALEEGWIPKEITVIARHRRDPSIAPGLRPEGQFELAEAQVAWLQEVADSARSLTAAVPCGIFGTSLAATWLFAEVGGAVAFFVDEDPNRIGSPYLGKPVLHPRDVRAGSPVLMALPPQLSEPLLLRLRRSYPQCHTLLLPHIDARGRVAS
jgi:SAM-dependent methyltransferase